jgi:hypothetical protein
MFLQSLCTVKPIRRQNSFSDTLIEHGATANKSDTIVHWLLLHKTHPTMWSVISGVPCVILVYSYIWYWWQEFLFVKWENYISLSCQIKTESVLIYDSSNKLKILAGKQYNIRPKIITRNFNKLLCNKLAVCIRVRYQSVLLWRLRLATTCKQPLFRCTS